MSAPLLAGSPETLRREGFAVAVDRTSESFARFVVTTGHYPRSALKVELGFDTLLFPAFKARLATARQSVNSAPTRCWPPLPATNPVTSVTSMTWPRS